MPDKVPLGGANKKPPPAIELEEDVPHKTKKRAKSAYEIQRRRAKFWDEVRGYLRLIAFVGLIVGCYYAYLYVTEPEYMRNDRFAIMEKILIQPSKYKNHGQTTALGAPGSIVYPPKYIFKCLGDDTREHYFVVVDENLYHSVPLRTIYSLSEVERYQVFNSLGELQTHYSSLELPPVDPAEEGDGVSPIEKLREVLGF